MKRSLFTIIFLCFVLHSNATVLFVSRTGNDANSGLSWASAKYSIQGAITAAQSGDTIFVSVGSYSGFSLKNNIHLYGGFTGVETTLSQRPSLTYGCLPNGNCTRVSSIIYTPSNIGKIDTLSLVNGFVVNVNSDDYAISAKGNVLVDNCDLSGGNTACVLLECNAAIFNSFVHDSRLGIRAYNNTSGIYSLEISNCKIMNNSLAVYSYNGHSAGSINLTINSCIIANNNQSVSGSTNYQGIVTIVDTRNFFINNSFIINNKYINTGNNSVLISSGIYSTANTHISNCVIANNTATATNSNAGGIVVGGAYIGNASSSIQNCVFANNSAVHSNESKKYILYSTQAIQMYNNIIYDTSNFSHNANCTFYNCNSS